MQLNDLDSTWNRTERDKLNQNWQTIISTFLDMQRQLKHLAGDETVDALLNNISEAIQAALDAEQATLNAIQGADDATELALEATDLAEQKAQLANDKAVIAQEKIDFIESHEQQIEYFTNQQTNLQAQVNQIVANGDSSVEAAQARVGVDDTIYSTLKERIDEEMLEKEQKIQIVTAQLAQTSQEVDNVSTTVQQHTLEISQKAAQTQVTNLSNQKADIVYVDTLIGNATSGAPKETFLSVSALNAAYPTGANYPVFVYDSALMDGAHTFAWDGTQWRDMGLYQGIDVRDESVTPRKIVTNNIINSLFKWTVGNIIFTNGANQVRDTRVRVITPVKVTKGTIIKPINTETYSYNLFLYENEALSSFINAPFGEGWFTNEYEVQYDCYIRLALRFNDDRVISNVSELNMSNALLVSQYLKIDGENIDLESVGERHLVAEVKDKLKIRTKETELPKSKMEFAIGGVYRGSGANDDTKNNRLRTRIPIFYPKGTAFKVSDIANYSYNIYLYNTSAISSYRGTTLGAPLGGDWYNDEYVLTEDAYVRVALRFNDNRVITSTSQLNVDTVLTITNYMNVTKENIAIKSVDKERLSDDLRAELLPTNKSYYPRYENIPVSFGIFQDGCVVGDELWFFYASNTTGALADIKRLNKNTFEELPVFKHSLGHVNSADYLNGKLMTYDPDTELMYLYSSPIGKTQLNYNDAECIVMSFAKTSSTNQTIKFDALGGAMCFGEDERTLYYLAYDKNNTDKVQTVYKITLGMGANDLSDQTATKDNLTNFGTFISGKANNEYNGTAQVIAKFEGNLSGRLYSRPQGATFDGKLYVSAGFEKLHAYEIALSYETNKYKVSRDFIYDYKDDTGVSRKIESEVALILDGKLFVGGYSHNSVEGYRGYLAKTNI